MSDLAARDRADGGADPARAVATGRLPDPESRLYATTMFAGHPDSPVLKPLSGPKGFGTRGDRR